MPNLRHESEFCYCHNTLPWQERIFTTNLRYYRITVTIEKSYDDAKIHHVQIKNDAKRLSSLNSAMRQGCCVHSEDSEK